MVLRFLSLRRPAALLAVAGFTVSFAASASPAGDALLRLRSEPWITRSYTLADLGITEPVVLSGSDARQEFFLPVPRSLPLSDATLEFSGRFQKTEEGRTSLLLYVAGKPVFSRRVEGAEGDASQTVKLDALARGTGFVRLGVNWSSTVKLNACEADRPTGNVLSIGPDTRLSYRFHNDALTSLADAWVTLPARPVLLVASRQVSKESFDTAWRLGVALDLARRQVEVRAFPAAGDVIDTSGLKVPAPLAALPAFAGLAAGDPRYVLKDAAEAGALVVLGASVATGDIAVADAALQQQTAQALDALGAQFAGDADAIRALAEWRGAQTALSGGALASHQIRLGTLGTRPVIQVAEDAGAQAAGVFAEAWRGILNARQVGVERADVPQGGDGAAIRLSTLGGSDATFDVTVRGDWTATLGLGAVGGKGGVPSALVVDVAAAPGASSTRPVASVYWNNILLSAKRLDADGRPERLDARIPGYALGLSNVVRVSFQRQPYSNDCNETPQGYPVSVLPTSLVRLGDSHPDGTFVGLMPLMSAAPQLIVPQAYLADAPTHLARVVRMALAGGVTPLRAELLVAPAGKAVTPSRPFMSLEVPVDGASTKVEVEGERLRINGRDTPWLDVRGLAGLSAVEVTRAHGHDGLRWQTLGASPGAPAAVAVSGVIAEQKPFVLNRGDIALLGPQGPVSWIDSSDPDAGQPPRAGESVFHEWRRYLSWGVPLVGLGLLGFLVIMVLAYRARSRSEKKAP
ncbi:cellulose biosynthesis cyclic di-GMP-binding regulatory protein BcsB [Variovorax ginsengisoli]|uniref:Cyclic di-GMP-binding protein n=1 Tax=Variovorax ginsengisoli TaxID=363844 RepID=A0ABT9S8G3_9BURK|nr:cellulose biosynthesis cyclic di-GMP-binding regulatory protein BcsB [Variovorax ginsengisoli]MDP9900643.1 hypothetical protein [Variovorax ginsengisoli]